VEVSGKLLFVAGSPAVDAGDRIVTLVMPPFYFSSYIQLFEAGTTVAVRGREVVSAAASSQGGKDFVVVEAITVAGKTFTIFRAQAGVSGAIFGPRLSPRGQGASASTGGGHVGPGRR